MTDVPATRRVVRSEHREKPLKAGIACAVIGLLTIVAGAVVYSAVQATQVLASIADADVGESLTFDADGGTRYSLVLMRGEISDENVVDRLVGDTTCTIEASDGTTKTVDGSKQFSSSQTSFGASIGTFEVSGGATKVTCVGEGSRLAFDRYAVAPERRTAKVISYVLIGLGVMLGLVGAWLIKLGWKSRTVVERVPI